MHDEQRRACLSHHVVNSQASNILGHESSKYLTLRHAKQDSVDCHASIVEKQVFY
jgi:hypothetical protein